jgi:HSP20 family molecular chaperone IbpA
MLDLWHDLDRTLAALDRQRSDPRMVASEPRLHIDETPTGWTLDVDVPGVSADQVMLTVEDGLLRLEAARSLTPPADARPVRRERTAWTLRRTVRLPDEVDPDAITARLVAGRLVVDLPRRATPAARTVPVQAN